MTNKEDREWVEPKFDAMGMTQWHWRVLFHENFKMGNNVVIGSFTLIDARVGVEIEDDVGVAFGCVIMSHTTMDNKRGKVILRKGCQIGANTVIMPGVEIGEKARVGANSYVNRNIPPNEVWFGSPARFYKKGVDSYLDSYLKE